VCLHFIPINSADAYKKTAIYNLDQCHFLGEDEKEIKKRLKEEEKRKKQAEKEGEENSEVAVVSEEVKDIKLTPLQEWENSLMSSTSYAQLFVHMTTLDSSIIWSK
jgi:hypothetical protein